MDLPQNLTSYPMLEKLGLKLNKTSNGKKAIYFNYESVPFGPYEVETDEEVRAVIAVAKERAEEKENRFNDKRVVPSTAATTAKFTLGAELTNRIRKDFNSDQMKLRSGGKKRTYPKRSQIIKIDPVTKELILPNGERRANPSIIEDEIKDSNITKIEVKDSKIEHENKVESGQPTFEIQQKIFIDNYFNPAFWILMLRNNNEC